MLVSWDATIAKDTCDNIMKDVSEFIKTYLDSVVTNSLLNTSYTMKLNPRFWFSSHYDPLLAKHEDNMAFTFDLHLALKMGQKVTPVPLYMQCGSFVAVIGEEAQLQSQAFVVLHSSIPMYASILQTISDKVMSVCEDMVLPVYERARFYTNYYTQTAKVYRSISEGTMNSKHIVENMTTVWTRCLYQSMMSDSKMGMSANLKVLFKLISDLIDTCAETYSTAITSLTAKLGKSFFKLLDSKPPGIVDRDVQLFKDITVKLAYLLKIGVYEDIGGCVFSTNERVIFFSYTASGVEKSDQNCETAERYALFSHLQGAK